jgi:hypothetical protein
VRGPVCCERAHTHTRDRGVGTYCGEAESVRASARGHLEFGNEQRELELREQKLVHQRERQRGKQIEHH